MTLHVGSVLAGRYEVTAPIATGGMGEVWRAKDRTLGRTIALKVLRTEYAGDTSFLIRFRNEARHTAALSHANIASVYDYGESMQDGQRLAYLVMEYVEGKPLVTLLAEFGRLTPEQTLDVLGQAGDGLSAAHAAGMVHRDIKPGNLLVRPDGVVKLTDFGIARARDAVPLTRTGMVVGTAQYLSPEQAQGFTVTPASDVYSLGVVGYECLAGTRPFDGESQVAIALAQINRPPPPLPADVPPAVRALIDRALAKDPADRFADGGAFADAVRLVAAGGTPPPTGRTLVVSPDAAGTSVIPMVGAGTSAGPRTAPRTGARTGSRTAVPPLPPLAASPVDDDGYDHDGYDGEFADAAEDQRSRRRTRLLWLATALVVLLVAGGLYLVLTSGQTGGGGTAGGTDPSAGASGSATDDQVLIDTDSYVGRPYAEVRDELTTAGLQVQVKTADADQLADVTVPLDAGDVVTTAPADTTVAKQTEVTLYYTRTRFTPDDATASTQPSSAPASTTQAVPTGNGGRPTTSAPPTSDPATQSTAKTSTSSSSSTTTTSTSTSTSTASDPAAAGAPGVTTP